MSTPFADEQNTDDPYEIRLFIEEVCCELFRFEMANEAGIPPEAVRIDREVHLGPEAFADIRVSVPDGAPTFVEVKYGLPYQTVLDRIGFKYGRDSDAFRCPARLLVLAEDGDPGRSGALADDLRTRVAPRLELRTMSQEQLASRLGTQFGVDSLDTDRFQDLREAILHMKWTHAYGHPSGLPLGGAAIRDELLWRFAFWRLREIRDAGRPDPRSILQPGTYRDVAIVMADMCSFSSFVRDTPDHAIIRRSLTAFYSKARYEIINRGGMLDNFVGDMALGLFGVPDARAGYVEDAFAAARALSEVGDAVANHWQRQIDRVQPSKGVHIGMALGDLQVVPLRPLSRTKAGVIADSINVATRLMSAAAAGEIVLSNAFYNRLSPNSRGGMEKLAPIEGRNVGSLHAWKVASVTR